MMDSDDATKIADPVTRMNQKVFSIMTYQKIVKF